MTQQVQMTSRPPVIEKRGQDGALQQNIQHTSSRIDCKGLLRSRPRVYGTMQKEHILLQPRMMERYVLMLPAGLTGRMSAYVSSVLS